MKVIFKPSFLIITITFLTLMLFGNNEGIAQDSSFANDRNPVAQVLVFSKTVGFRHPSITAGINAIKALGEENNFNVYATENATDFSDQGLAQYQALIFLNTSLNVLNDKQQRAMERYIQAGGGFVGIHSAAATESQGDWVWYNNLVGGFLDNHPAVQAASVSVVDNTHLSTENLPKSFVITDEWYNYRQLYPSINVLLSVDEQTYQGGSHGAYHPIAWYHEYDGGRSFYTGLGHRPKNFANQHFLAHLMGGIQYAMGSTQAPSQRTVRVRVKQRSDDAEEASTLGTMDIASSDLEMAKERAKQLVGLRFQSLEIPAQATITHAYIEFETDEKSPKGATLQLYGQAANNPRTFNKEKYNISSREPTLARVSWNPAGWPTIGAKHQTADLTEIVKELVSRDDWQAGNAMVFVVVGNGKVTAESYDGEAANAPLLVIDYVVPGSGSSKSAPSALVSSNLSTGKVPLKVKFRGSDSTDADGTVVSYHWDFGDHGSAVTANPNHTYTQVGDYKAVLTVTDDDGLFASQTMTIKVAAASPSSGNTIRVRVQQRSDDAEENMSRGSVKVASSDLEMVEEKGGQLVGLRFQNLALPTQAIITEAYIEFEADERSNQGADLYLYGQATDNPKSFVNKARNISSRPSTLATVGWAPAAWKTVSAKHKTADLAAIVQELVNRDGWQAGNAMVFMIAGRGKVTAESYDGEFANAPILVVSYIEAGPVQAIFTSPISLERGSESKPQEQLRSNTTSTLSLEQDNFDQTVGIFSIGREPIWELQSIADFNGDGYADLLFRDVLTGGWYGYLLYDKIVISNGVVAINNDSGWILMSDEDQNDDFKADLLLQNSSGVEYIYLMDGLVVRTPALDRFKLQQTKQ